MSIIQNIIIGKPIVPAWSLLTDSQDDKIYGEITAYDDERNLPRLLVKYGVAPSTSEVRRNRKDLVRDLNDLDFVHVKYGKKHMWIIVGAHDEEEYQKYMEESHGQE